MYSSVEPGNTLKNLFQGGMIAKYKNLHPYITFVIDTV